MRGCDAIDLDNSLKITQRISEMWNLLNRNFEAGSLSKNWVLYQYGADAIVVDVATDGDKLISINIFNHRNNFNFEIQIVRPETDVYANIFGIGIFGYGMLLLTTPTGSGGKILSAARIQYGDICKKVDNILGSVEDILGMKTDDYKKTFIALKQLELELLTNY